MLNLIRKFVAPVSAKAAALTARPPAIQPFGPDFGLTILPDYLNYDERKDIKEAILDTYLRQASTIKPSDGRFHLPPIAPFTITSVVDRMERDQLVLPGWLNNQTVNMFLAGDFIRAHVDNLFLYDDTFAILSLGSPATMKLVHLQNGEELEVLIPEGCVYVMEGPSRYIYLHMVMPVESPRMSVVLRRCCLRSSGNFRDVSPEVNGILPYRANALVAALLSKSIGVPRIPIDDEWLEAHKIGPFDTARFVEQLRPMRDWSLLKQLDEDEQRYRELVQMKYVNIDMAWRFAELRKQFKLIEEEVTLKAPVRPPKQSASRLSSVPTAATTGGVAEGDRTPPCGPGCEHPQHNSH